jgi:alpha-L-fucosidase 2
MKKLSYNSIPVSSGIRALIMSLIILIFDTGLKVSAQKNRDVINQLNSYNVIWDVPGPGSAQSMPLGNGDIGLNLWVEPNGNLNFYISKTDSWSENNRGTWGLLKLGRVVVSLEPRPALTTFLQVLKLRTGEILIKEGATTYRVWVDANNPVIRVEAQSKRPVSMTVRLNNWRRVTQNSISADTILHGETNKITWYHRNSSTSDVHVANNTFGAIIKGNNLVNSSDTTLISSTPATSQLISIYPLTVPGTTSAGWLTKLNEKVAGIESLNYEKTRSSHQEWWNQFWHRSWIFIRGDTTATKTTRGYILQRFVTACGGRGAYPIKFNGSIFTVDDPALIPVGEKVARSVNPDFRWWGGQYWFQNTRAMYWPRLEAGDFDIMLPLFNMYAKIIPDNAKQVLTYYKHEGSYFAETAPFWGGISYAGPEVRENWTTHYFTPVLELSMMMLDYYEYTGDNEFARQTLLPVAKAGITFFDKHFQRDSTGRLLLDPVNSIEMYWKVHNPAPDIAGLRAILPRLIALPDNLADKASKASWCSLLQQMPPLPVGKSGNESVLLPYTGPQTAKFRNSENPELYAVYPFRIYGMGKPDLQLAINTFKARKMTFKGCWSQDPEQAAMLGLSDIAKKYVEFNFNFKDPRLKFPAFWLQKNDYAPDQDNGGNGEMGLQQMVMQADGRKILLLPTWPAGWEGDFKLNAPFRTTVQGTIKQGHVTNLVVTPAERKADVIDLSLSSLEIAK